MTAHARCAGPENTLVEAAGLMRELNVGALPVCEDDRIAGIITDRDMAIRAIANGRDPNTTAVGEVMTPMVVHIFADQAVEEAARLMQQNEIRRLPVVNRSRRLVGIVSLGDIAVSSNPAFSGTTLREISQPVELNGRARKRDALGRAAGAGVVATATATRNGDQERETGPAETAARRGPTRKRSATGAGKPSGATRSASSGGQRPKKTKAKPVSARSRSSAPSKGAASRSKSSRRKNTTRAAG